MPTQQPEMLAYVFGDQTHDLTDDLLGLLQSRDDPLVVNFLERSCAVLKSETARLPPDHQARCPRFSSIADLLAPYSERALNPCLVQALTCITQLGLFIRQHSSRCEAYPSPERTCLAGVCTGAIAAAAVSFAHSAPSLLSPALHAVTVAVRVGALAWDVADRISHHHGDDESAPPTETDAAAAAFESWSRVVAGCSLSSLNDTLLRYASDSGLSAIKTPYISAVLGPTQATVSGPPEVLSDFFTSAACKEIAPSSASLRITAPYHSAVLFHEEDIEQILEGVPKSGRQPDIDGIPIISISAESQQQQEEQGLYKAVGSQDLHEAFGQAVRECLIRAVALDKLPGRIAEHAKAVVAPAGTQHPARVSLRFFGVQNRESLVAQMRLLLPSDAYCVTQAMTGQTLEDCPASPSPSVSASIPNSSRNVPEDAAATAAEGSNAKQPLAILSASGRFPGNADTMDQFWDILYNGIDTHEMVPPSRWDASTHVGDTSIKNVSGTGYGCWLHQAGQFDTTFFNISPREASRIDPAQRLALMTAAEALEKAGIVPDRTPSTMRHRVGVWYGSCSMDWLETNSAQDIDAYFIPGGARAFIAGRVNYFFKFTGPSFTVDTACSSSLAALHLACNALWRGEVDTAVVGGTNMTTNPDITAGLDRGHFLSRTGNCKTFDDAADGYCRGEAAVTLVLKRLSDARRDNDPIEACLLSVATNHNAEAESITRPNTAAQRELFRGLLADAVVRPNDISYVEMHGTGTQAGDAGETSSIVNTLSPLTARGSCLRPASSPLYLGAAKANVGHSEAASGVTSIAKVLMMMKHSIIPPHIGVKTEFNRRLPNLAQRNARIAMVPTAWPRPPHGGSRRVLLNNFSAAGGNTSIVMEDAPPPCVTDDETGIDPRRRHVVTISAKTPESLVLNVSNLAHWLEDEAEAEAEVSSLSSQQHQDASNQNLLAQLSYTTTARRTHHRYRVAVVAGSASKLASSLRKQLETLNGGDKILPAPSRAPGVVFTFTGQGSQYAGMGEALYARSASFRTDLRRCDHLCVRMGYPSIAALFETAASSRDAFDRASLTCLQLAHVSFQMALCKLWESFGITPTAVVGHSLGEYAALYAAGVLSQSDVLYLVGRRSQIMEEQLPEGTHAMLAVKAGEASIVQHLDVGVGVGEVLEVACRNGPANTVLGGAISDIQEAQSALEAKGIRCRVLETAHAFHTAQVEPVLAYFRKATRGVVMRRPRIPVLSPVLGKVLRESADFGDDYFVKHCRQPVNLVQAVSAAAVEGVVGNRTFAIEIGPAPLVAPMVRDIIGNRTTIQTCASVNKTMDPWQLLAEALSRLYLAGVSVDWNKYHQDFPECHRVLPIPVYGWTLKEYWMQYTNDWSLRKGDPAWVAPREVPLAFSSIYKVVKNTLQASVGGEAVVDIDLQDDDDVRAMARGHKVYGVSLVTPSMYADVAQMIGKYVLRDTNTGPGGEAVVPEVAEMRIQSALVANDVNAKQVLRTTAKFNEAKTSLSCSFSSVDSNGKIVEQHANCVIRFVDVDAVRARSREAADHAAACMKDMQSCFGVDDNIFRLSRSMLYKMVGKIADFDPRYRGLSSFTINNGTLEALGVASFKGMPESGKWFANPGFLDAVSQLAGFAMNANESIDIEREVYVNHGWESMTLFAPRLDVDATYRLYVRMVPAENDLWRGDVFVFDDEEEGGALAGVLRGCALQRVSKRVMEFIVNSASKKSSSSSSPRGIAAAHERSQSQSRWDTGLPRRSASECRTPAPVPVKGPATTQDAWPRALKIVAEESGMEEDELADGVALGDIGVDSLLSLVITGRLHDELDIDLPGRSLFEECLTIGDIRTCLFGGAGAPLVEDAAEPIAFTSTASVTASSTACSDDTDSATTISSGSRTHTYGNMEDSHYHSGLEIGDGVGHHEKKTLQQSPPPTAISPGKAPPAWSMYVQGARGRSKENLFFFPDGCGTATSYLCLPSISPDMALIAFNSPFAKNPERMYEYSLQDVLQSYLDGIRSRQPHGPYRLGGWSAGGILAYAAAQKLIAAGEDVISLTIIDSPAPVRGLEILPESFYDHCLRTGIFRSEMRRDTAARTDGGPGGAVSGSGQKWADPPEWLVAHFRAATALLSDYYAQPLPAEAARRMRVTIVWAGQTAFDGVRYASLSEALRADAEAGEREGVRFLTESRTDFGPGDWAKLLPGAAISTHAVEGEHHFSIMRGKGAEKVVEFVRGGL